MAVFKNKYRNELGSTLTLGLLGVAGAYSVESQFPDTLKHMKDSLNSARDVGKTVTDVALGGPEGYRAASNLEDALEMVQKASFDNVEARQALEKYGTQRKDFAQELVGVYERNETLGREAERLKINLEATLKSLYDAGNSMKPEMFRKIDDVVIKLYGKDPIKAREESGRLGDFYKEVGKFYSSREKNEHTVKEFCDYLAELQGTSKSHNELINELFPSVVEGVKEGYETEDHLFSTGERNILGLRSDVKPGDLEITLEKVDDYGSKVDDNYAAVGKQVPIEPYRETNIVDYLMSPVTIGIAAALIVKGATKTIPPIIERPITWAIGLPFSLIAFGVGALGKKTGRRINHAYEWSREKFKKKEDHDQTEGNEDGN